MPDIIVAISKVSDGSMYNRHDPFDPIIIENRRKFLAKQGIKLDQTTHVYTGSLYSRDQIEHDDDFCRYQIVSSKDKGRGMTADAVVSDGLATAEVGQALFLPIADCVATALYDPKERVLMVVHLGRHALEESGAKKAIQYLVDNYGVNPVSLKAWLTPAPGKDVYPIWALDNKGMKEVLFEQLDAAGLERTNIIDNPAETNRDPDYFSYTEFFNGRREEDGDYCIVAMMT